MSQQASFKLCVSTVPAARFLIYLNDELWPDNISQNPLLFLAWTGVLNHTTTIVKRAFIKPVGISQSYHFSMKFWTKSQLLLSGDCWTQGWWHRTWAIGFLEGRGWYKLNPDEQEAHKGVYGLLRVEELIFQSPTYNVCKTWLHFLPIIRLRDVSESLIICLVLP